MLHLDYELGQEETQRRYQRLAAGLGADLASIGPRIRTCSFPPFYVSDEDAEDRIARACEGRRVVIIDSLAAAVINAKGENDTSMRRHLDRLTRISDRLKVVFVVLVHEGKQGERERPQLQKVRGASAIIDAAGNVLSVASRNGDLTVAHTKPSFGKAGADVVVRFEDVEHTRPPEGPDEELVRRARRAAFRNSLQLGEQAGAGACRGARGRHLGFA